MPNTATELALKYTFCELVVLKSTSPLKGLISDALRIKGDEAYERFLSHYHQSSN